ncbi:hypothetical protein [Streptomyces sp. NPDC005438]|uniref:hypothetical protein n=1 Tax=Streptomyces sp. NPDC005438 TaxID=3156880 RepID=UPI0033B78540
MHDFQRPPSGADGWGDEPEPSGQLDTDRISGFLVFALVVVFLHALGNVAGGWAVLDENYSRQEHGQEPILSMSAAWLVALFCWALAALHTVLVVLARKRRSWVRTALAALMILMVFSTGLGFFASLVTGAPDPVILVILAVDVAALWALVGEAGRRWFSLTPEW